MFTLYVHPGGYSSNYVELLLTELDLKYIREVIDLHKWQQYSREFLSLNPSGTVPVLVTPDSETHCGLKPIRKYLLENHGDRELFRGGSRYLSKLDDIPIGLVTYGLAFHPEHTHVLRYPFNSDEFLEISRSYILSRSDKLLETANRVTDESCKNQLIQLSAEHQTSLTSYVDDAGYDQLIKQLKNVLNYLEREFECDRVGLWLEGTAFTASDIALGLVLHRLWQLGLDSELFTDGVLPNLSVYYSRIRKRPSFITVTRCDQNHREKRLVHPDEKMAETAKYGLGAAAILGGLYLVKKMIKK